ncbi:MAG: hypothetical protein PHI31_05740, partial [Desulfuromonadaceae bacterium]|nr:hypothetical protein [Desulfuromonadaceae bacterium]
KAEQSADGTVAVCRDEPVNPVRPETEAHKRRTKRVAGITSGKTMDGRSSKSQTDQVIAGDREQSANDIVPPNDSEQTHRCQLYSADSAALLEASVTTELGGLFYLINVGIFLNLYGDFTRPLQPGIALPIWTFVTLIGRRLLGDTCEDDPVWQLLAELSGCCGSEVPENDFMPSERWQLPAEWLAPFPEAGCWQWKATDGRLTVRHTEGFLVLDLPLDAGAPLEQLLRETEAYGQVVPFELEYGAVTESGNSMSPLDRWLDRLMPYLQARLKRALGVAETERIPQVLCRQSARISVSAAHIDVFFALAEHPIDIRLAGLDRNPGWVPASGRIVAFHYE